MRYGYGYRYTQRRRCGPFGPSFGALTLAASSIVENSTAGTVVGGILGKTAGSTLTLTDSAGSRFAISGTNLVAGATPTDFETATSHNITIRESKAGYSDRFTTLTITVVNQFEQPNLAALTLSATTFYLGTPASGSINGATAGSTIAASGLPSGLTINGPARTWTWSGSGAAATGNLILTETLADSANSPRGSTIAWAVSAASVPEITTAPTLTDAQTDGAVQTFNPGSGTNIGSFRIQYYNDAAVVATLNINAGDAFPTRAYNYATERGLFRFIRVTPYSGANQTGVAGTAVDSVVRIGLYNSLIYSTGFDLNGLGDPTALTANVFDAGIWKHSSGGASTRLQIHLDELYAYSNPGAEAWTIDTGAPLPAPKMTIAKNAGENNATSLRTLVTLYADNSNRVVLEAAANGWSLRKVVATSSTQLIAFQSRTYVEGDAWEIKPENIGGQVYIKVFLNGAHTAASAALNGGNGAGPISDAVLVNATKCGIFGSNWLSATPCRILTAFSINSPNANTVTVSASAPIVSPTDPTKQRVTLSGGYTGSVTSLEWAMLDPTGKVLVNWTAITSESGGAYSDAVDFAWADGGTITALVRDADGKITIAQATFAALIMPSANPLLMGLNVGGLQTGQVTANLMQTFTIDMANVYSEPGDATSAGPTGFALNAIGFPTRIPSGGYVELFRDYAWPASAASDVFGTYTFEFHPDLIWSISSGAGALTETGRNQTGGTATVTVNSAVAGSYAIPIIRITSFPADPANCYLRAYKQGASPSDKAMVLRPQANNYHSHFASLRNMDVKITNRSSGLAPISPAKLVLDEPWSTRVQRFSPGMMLRMCRQTGARPWDCLADMMTGAAIRAYAQYLKDNLLPGEIYGIEWGNEIWNDSFNQAQHSMRSSPNFRAGASYALQEGDYVKGNTGTFTGSVAGNTLTITGVTSGALKVGHVVSGANIAAGTRIVSMASGTTGGVGTYTVDKASTAASTTISAALVVMVAQQKVLTGSIGGGNATGYFLIATDMSNKGAGLWNAPFSDNEVLHHCDQSGAVLHGNVMIMEPQAIQPSEEVSYARRFKWVIEQFETVWGTIDPATTQIKFIAAWQAALGSSNFAAVLNEQNLYQKVAFFAIAPYGPNFGDYHDTGSMPKDDRDKALADIAGFNAAYDTAIRAKVAAACATYQSMAVWLAGYCVGKGLPKDRIQPATYECAPQHQIESNTPWLQFTNGNCTYAAALDGTDNIVGFGAYRLRGKLSGATARVGSSGGDSNSKGSTKASGTFAGGNATGYLTKGNQFTGNFQAGEVCDLYLWRNNLAAELAAGPVQDSVLTIDTITDIQTATRNAWAAFWRSAAFGAIYKTYLDGIAIYGGWHNIFTGHGEDASAKWNYGDWGYWHISAFVEDQAQHPYADIVAWIGEHA